MIKGIDLSSNNSDNWKSDTTWDFAIVKCTEGKSYVNPDYREQIGEARARGKVVGHYHWLNNGPSDAQEDWFASKVDLQPGDIIAVDWEDSSNPTTEQKDAFIRSLQERFQPHKVGLYCNRDWWFNHDTSGFFGDYLWIAVYGADDPGIQAEWTIWQYTDIPPRLPYGGEP